MNYSRYSLQRSMRELNSRSEKRVRKVSLLLLQLFIIIFFAAIIIAVSAGLGAFRSIIDSAPSIGNIDVTPTGFSPSSMTPRADRRQNSSPPIPTASR